MAAPLGNKNGVGNSGGKTLMDRELASKVRKLALEKIQAILEMPVVKMTTDDYKLYQAVLIRLSGTVLPRINEFSDESGPLQIKIISYGDKDAINNSTISMDTRTAPTSNSNSSSAS